MKKHLLFSVATLAAVCLLSGCSSLETSDKFNSLGVAADRTEPIAHINSSIWGLYLFDSIPIICGSANSSGKSATFMDTVTLDNALLVATRRARGIGASKFIDIRSDIRSEWFLLLPIFWIREVQVSGTAIK